MARKRPGVLLYRTMSSGEEQILLAHDVITLGRSDTCTLVVPLQTVSRLHARIELQHERYMLFDNGSANGTFVNGKRIDQGYQLSTGDTIWLGSEDATFTFVDPEETLVVAITPPIEIDMEARLVNVYGDPTPLSPLEYGLLVYLASNPGTVCTREACFLQVWGQPYDPATCEDAFNACVTKLRRNLRAAAERSGHEPPQITTLLRVGFRLDADVTFTNRSDPAPLSASTPP